MKEPEKIPLTNNPRSRDIQKIPLTKVESDPDIDNYKRLWITVTDNENNSKNDSQSISELESYETD